MARQSYQARLDELRENVLYMSEVVLDRLRLALEALESKDHDLAWQVIEGDDEVNEYYLELEGACVDLLALQQPVAGDLRFIAASFKIITDLERVADLAVNLGDYTLEASRDLYPEVDVQAIGRETIGMLEDSMSAYADQDVALCYEVARRDDAVDEQCKRASEVVVRDLIETELEPDADDEEVENLMGDVSRVLLMIRDLERVGDHAVNIAARTLYMAENDDELLY